MSRSNRTARQAGAGFEQAVADYLAWALDDDRIVRMPKHGSNDMGDIANIRFMGQRVCLECKSLSRNSWKGPLDEARVEAGHLDAPFYWVVSKRMGVGLTQGSMGRQLAYTDAAMLIHMEAAAPEIVSIQNAENFHRIPRTPFFSCDLRSLALILNHGLPLGPEEE